VSDPSRLRLGIDLGGTKTEIVALDRDGRERLRRRRPTPAADGYEAILATVCELVTEAERELGAQGTVGIGTPGAISPASGLLRNSNTVCLNGRPLVTDLSAALGREVRLANDANCFALSEAHDGAGAGAEVVFGVILGTGTGGGVVVRGRVLGGANAIAGEWGHTPLPWPRDDERPGPTCYCGRRGCVESWISGPGLTADHERVAGERLAAEAIAQAASQGEPHATATLERHADRLARSLAVVLDVLDPHVVVLGGGVSRLPGLCDELVARLPAHVFSDVVRTRIVLPVHGDSSGVRGAAWLWD
jgi:fructokinase